MRHPYISSLSISYPQLKSLQCEDLAPGLNVIYGPNEAGKSRIKDFIEWAMFAYAQEHESLSPQARKKAFQHLTPGIAGRFSIATNDTNIYVHQKRLNDLTEVSIENSSFSHSDIAALLTDNMSLQHYKDIFSLSLDELSFTKSKRLLTEDELAEIFLNASHTGSGVSISQLISILNAEKDELFSPAGNARKQTINKLMRELAEINKEISSIKRQEGDNLGLEDSLKTKIDLSNDIALEINEIDIRLKEKKELLEYYDKYERYVTLQEEESPQISSVLAKKYNEIDILIEEIKNTLPKEHETELLESQLQTLIQEHEEQHGLLVHTLDPQELKEYAATPDFLSQVKRYEQSAAETNRNIGSVQEKIRDKTRELSYLSEFSDDIHNQINEIESKPASKPQIEKQKPKRNFGAIAIPTFISLTLIAVGFLLAHFVVIAVGLVALTASFIPFVFVKEQPQLEIIDDREFELKPLKQKLSETQSKIEHYESVIAELIEEQNQLEKDLEDKRGTYMEALNKAGFETYFEPNLIDIYLGTFQEYKNRKQKIEDIEAKLKSNSLAIADLIERTNSFIQYTKNTDAEIEIKLDTLAQSLTWLNTVAQVSLDHRNLLENDTKKQNKIAELEEDLSNKFSSIDKALEIFSATSLEQLNSEISEIQNNKYELNSQRDAINQEVGSLKHQIEAASNSTQLIEAQRKREELTEELKEQHNKYAVSYISAKLAEQSFDHSQRENQPEVLRTASWMLKEITAGNWDQVSVVYVESKKQNEPRIQVTNTSNATSLLASQLSRGTQEQLYLALRFALMQTSIKGQHVPVLLDDIAVNFDRDRFKSMTSLLRDLAFDRQLFYFTCHSQTRDILAEIPTASVTTLRD